MEKTTYELIVECYGQIWVSEIFYLSTMWEKESLVKWARDSKIAFFNECVDAMIDNKIIYNQQP